jgi:hypothetical protein
VCGGWVDAGDLIQLCHRRHERAHLSIDLGLIRK